MILKDVIKADVQQQTRLTFTFRYFNIGVNNRFKLNFHDCRNCPLKDFSVITGIYKKEFEFHQTI